MSLTDKTPDQSTEYPQIPAAECLYADIAVEAPLTQVFSYSIPDHLLGRVLPGSRVTAPFGPRKIQGFCVRLSNTPQCDPKRCKNLIDAGPEGEIVFPELLKLTRWAADYYHSGWGMVLAAAVPSAVRKGKQQESALYVWLEKSPEETELERVLLRKNATKQNALLLKMLEYHRSGTVCIAASELLAESGATHSTLRSLEKSQLLHVEEKPLIRSHAILPQTFKDITLNPEQETAVFKINEALDKREFSPFLLHGITGSGKTEVYLQAMSHALSQGRTVLVLVPEISLTPQTVGRFRQRAGEVLSMHSHMADGERAEAWRQLRRGDVKVVVGARSAVFSPLPNLGLIIVDEEHEHTFKQENDPRYHGRDLAVMRGLHEKAVVVMGSATPSLESWNNAREGKYKLLQLTQRPGNARPPHTKVIDMKDECAEQKKMVMFSRKLQQELLNCLHHEKQAILFLNRRGFNTYIHCLGCGEPVKCPDCDVSLTYHKRQNKLRCHYCDHERPVPQECDNCSSVNLRFTGTGTERVEDILAKVLPEARLLRMDSDTMTGRDAHALALSAFARHEYDILLGTQMVTKGFDFPDVTLVGVLSADSALNMPDFRAAEKTFQLITQVVGRAGRADNPGTAVIQAFEPDHYAVQYAVAQDFVGFAEKELSTRKPLGYPPYGRVARLIGSGTDEAKVKTVLTELAQTMKKAAGNPFKVLGPNPCPLGKLQANFRYQVLIKANDHVEMAKILHAVNTQISKINNPRIMIDVDPTSLM